MNDEQIKQAIAQVEMMCGRKYPEGSRQLLVKNLHGMPVQAMIKVLGKIEQESTTLPTPILLSRMVREQATYYREQESAKEKRDHEAAQANALNPRTQPSPIGKDSCLLMKAMMSGRFKHDEILDVIRDLEGKYPKAGFALLGARLERDWEAIEREGN